MTLIPSGLLRTAIRFAACILLFAVGASLTSAQVSTKQRQGDVVYIVKGASLVRFNVASEAWVSTIALTEVPTAFFVDSSYIYLAYGRGLFRRNLDGTNETAVFNAPNAINGVLTDASLIFVFAPDYNTSFVYSIRKSDEQMASSWSGSYSLSSSYSINAPSKTLYGVNTMTTAFSTIELPYDSNGAFLSPKERWSDVGSFNAQGKTFVRPDGQMLLRQSNNLAYTIPGLTSTKATGGFYFDAVFDSSFNTYLLRSKALYVYDKSLLETVYYPLTGDFQGIEISGTKAYLFADETSGQVSMTKVDLPSIPASNPSDPLDPNRISYIPDDIIAGAGGVYYFLSKENASVFVWNSATSTYVKSYKLRNSPNVVAYSAVYNRLYIGYASGQIYQIKVDQGATNESPFASLPLAVRALSTAGNLIFAGDNSGAWFTHYTFDATGAPLASREWNYYSSEYLWNPTNERMYFYRDDTSPNDVLYEAINGTTGALSGPVDSPYHGDYSFLHPLRLSTDGNDIFTAAGVIYKASDLTYKAAISNVVTDAVYAGGSLVSIRQAGAGTQLQEWTANYLIKKALSITGEPFRILAAPSGNVWVLTKVEGRLMFNLVTMTSYTVASSPVIKKDLADASGYFSRPTRLEVEATGTGLQYQWYRNGVAIAGATSSFLVITPVDASASGLYQVRVNNAYGSVMSRAALFTASAPPSRLINISTRMDVGTGNGVAIAGFSISGIKPKTLLIRAAGPALSKFISSGLLVDPMLTVFNSNGAPIATNDNWDAALTSDFTAAGAFDWTAGSKDAALKLTLPAGNYTATVTGSAGQTGIALVEVYELDEASNADTRLVNISTRAMVRTVTGPAIAGFVIKGTLPKKVVIRGVGSTLSTFGVGSVMPNPKIRLTTADGTLVAENDDWNMDYTLAALFGQVGAFGLLWNNEAVLAPVLAPGNYTVQVSDTSSTDGVAIVEIYEAP